MCAPVTGSSDYPAEVEPNDTQSTANPLATGTKGFTGSLCPSGDKDIYSIDVTEGAAVSLKVSTDGTGCPLMHGIQMLLLDSSFVTIGADTSGERRTARRSAPTNTPEARLADGRHLFRQGAREPDWP